MLRPVCETAHFTKFYVSGCLQALPLSERVDFNSYMLADLGLSFSRFGRFCRFCW